MKYNFESYRKSAIKFIKDSQKWYALDDRNFYTSDNYGGWEETCDNANNGLNIRWAFKLNYSESEKDIETLIIEHFVTEIAQLIDVMCDNLSDDLEFYTEQIRELIESLKTIM